MQLLLRPHIYALGLGARSRDVQEAQLFYLNHAEQLRDLRAPSGNRLEALKGAWIDYHSIRIIDQWRVVFRWENGRASDIRVLDYH
jgi:proteic killer suppression protein